MINKSQSDDLHRFSFYLLTLCIWLITVFLIDFAVNFDAEDKYWHVWGLENAKHNPTEPIWAIWSGLVTYIYPSDPYVITIYITYIIFLSLFHFRLFEKKYALTILLSPGLLILVSQHIRQAFSIGIFFVFFILVNLPLMRKFTKRISFNKSQYLLHAVPIIASTLIHNSTFVPVVYVYSLKYLREIQSVRFKTSLIIILLFTNVALLLYFKDKSGFNSAAVFFCIQAGLVLLSWVRLIKVTDLVYLIFLFAGVSAGFLLSTTGLRVSIMFGIFAPMLLTKHIIPVQIFLLYFYPYYANDEIFAALSIR